jgi:hypothetical protein
VWSHLTEQRTNVPAAAGQLARASQQMFSSRDLYRQAHSTRTKIEEPVVLLRGICSDCEDSQVVGALYHLLQECVHMCTCCYWWFSLKCYFLKFARKHGEVKHTVLLKPLQKICVCQRVTTVGRQDTYKSPTTYLQQVL